MNEWLLVGAVLGGTILLLGGYGAVKGMLGGRKKSE